MSGVIQGPQVAAVADLLRGMIPASYSPLLTPELRESAARKLLVGLEQKGWSVVSHTEIEQLHGQVSSARVQVQECRDRLAKLTQSLDR